MRKKKIILVGLLAVVLIYVGTVIYKYNVLTKISNNKVATDKIEIYSCNIVQIFDDGTYKEENTYKNTNIQKTIHTILNGNGKAEFIEWEDENEKLRFSQNESSYAQIDYINSSAINNSSLYTSENENMVR